MAGLWATTSLESASETSREVRTDWRGAAAAVLVSISTNLGLNLGLLVVGEVVRGFDPEQGGLGVRRRVYWGDYCRHSTVGTLRSTGLGAAAAGHDAIRIGREAEGEG